MLVQFPAGALWSVLGQDSSFHIASVYPAAKWVPSMNKAVLRACVLYAASCSGIAPGGLKWFPCVYRPARGGRSCERFGGYKTINRIPLPYTFTTTTSTTTKNNNINNKSNNNNYNNENNNNSKLMITIIIIIIIIIMITLI